MGKNNLIARGFDFFSTICGCLRITISSGQEGGIGKGVNEIVTFIGANMKPAMGDADIIIERLEDAEIGKYARFRMLTLAIVSAAPVRIPMENGSAAFFDLYLTLSLTQQSRGKVAYFSDDGQSGTFVAASTIIPLVELRPLGGGHSIFVDTGVTRLPSFPIELGISEGRWSRQPDTDYAVRYFDGGTVFYRDELRFQMLDPQTNVLLSCSKHQAEFPGEDQVRRFERINFRQPKRFANLELSRRE